MAMKSGLTLTELDERIAAIRENLRELTEQTAADSGAGNDDLNSDRIAEQEKELADLTERREVLLRK
jgi:predicted mannosyl-3-phosphoglycerate phosphatase (HAD superfamily)